MDRLQHEERKINAQQADIKDKALALCIDNSFTSDKSIKAAKGVQCHYCKKFGHYKRLLETWNVGIFLASQRRVNLG